MLLLLIISTVCAINSHAACPISTTIATSAILAIITRTLLSLLLLLLFYVASPISRCFFQRSIVTSKTPGPSQNWGSPPRTPHGNRSNRRSMARAEYNDNTVCRFHISQNECHMPGLPDPEYDCLLRVASLSKRPKKTQSMKAVLWVPAWFSAWANMRQDQSQAKVSHRLLSLLTSPSPAAIAQFTAVLLSAAATIWIIAIIAFRTLFLLHSLVCGSC